MKAQNSLTITAVMDGVTLNGFLYVQQASLVQFYTKGTDVCIPNWKEEVDHQPIVSLVLRDTSTGEVFQSTENTLQEINWKYNGISLEFGPDGLCTAPAGLVGRIKKIAQYSTMVDGKSVTIPAVRIVDNLVPISDFDDDRLSVSGNVVISNQTIPFAEVGTTVQIQQAGGNALRLSILGDNTIFGTETSETLTAELRRDGAIVTDETAKAEFAIKWSKVPETTPFKNPANQWKLIVDQTDVDGSLHIRCDVFDKGNLKTPILTEFFDMHDRKDPWYLQFEVLPGKGNPVGTRLRRGQDLTIKPVAWHRTTPPVSKELGSCKWYSYNNKGDACTLPTTTGPQFNAATVKLSYDDVTSPTIGNGGVTLVCHAEFTE